MAIDPTTQQMMIGGVVVLVVVILVCCIFAPWRSMGPNNRAPMRVEDAPAEREADVEEEAPPEQKLDQSTRMQENDLDEKREAQLHRQALMLPTGRRHQMAAPTTGALVMASMRSRDGSGGRKLNNMGSRYSDTEVNMDDIQPASVGAYITTI